MFRLLVVTIFRVYQNLDIYRVITQPVSCNGKMYNASMPLKHQCYVKIFLRLFYYKVVIEISYIKTS